MPKDEQAGKGTSANERTDAGGALHRRSRSETGKAIIKNVLGKTQTEVKEN